MILLEFRYARKLDTILDTMYMPRLSSEGYLMSGTLLSDITGEEVKPCPTPTHPP